VPVERDDLIGEDRTVRSISRLFVLLLASWWKEESQHVWTPHDHPGTLKSQITIKT